MLVTKFVGGHLEFLLLYLVDPRWSLALNSLHLLVLLPRILHVRVGAAATSAGEGEAVLVAVCVGQDGGQVSVTVHGLSFLEPSVHVPRETTGIILHVSQVGDLRRLFAGTRGKLEHLPGTAHVLTVVTLLLHLGVLELYRGTLVEIGGGKPFLGGVLGHLVPHHGSGQHPAPEVLVVLKVGGLFLVTEHVTVVEHSSWLEHLVDAVPGFALVWEQTE